MPVGPCWLLDTVPAVPPHPAVAHSTTSLAPWSVTYALPPLTAMPQGSFRPPASVVGWHTLPEHVLPQHPWPQRPQLDASVLVLVHAPAQQVPEGQAVPSPTLVPVSLHTGTPVVHVTVPVWQG